MNLALLGWDSDVGHLLRYIEHHPRYRLARCCDADAGRDELRRLAPSAAYSEDWESLLAGSEVEAVIVAGDRRDERRIDQLRKLVQAKVPLLLVHPACESIVALELDMIRQDTDCPMVVYFPGCGHPALERLAEIVRAGSDSPIGAMEQLTFQRLQSNRDRPSVLAQFARDADILRSLLGEVKRVSATGDPATLANLSVHLVGSNDLGARWSVLPVDREPVAEITLFGSRGRIVVTLTDCDSQLAWNGSGTPSQGWQDWNAHALALESLEKAISGQTPAPSWADVCRDLDVVEAAERSVARGRVIELHFGQVTEADTFKSIMAAGGCLLLLLAMATVFAFAVIEGVRLAGHPDPESGGSPWRFWPFCLLAPLVMFLLLQFLQIVLKRPASSPRAASGKPDSGSDG